MSKRFLIFSFCLFFFYSGWGQTKPANKAGKGTKKTVVTNNPGTPSQRLINVLFATNEACELSINDEPKGEVEKTAFSYLKLAPGTYTYKAKSKATLDELTETFTVAEGATNEVFIDLLWVVDEKKAERATMLNASTEPLRTPLITNQKPEEFRPRKDTAIKNIDTIAAAINFFLSNMVYVKEGMFMMGNNYSPLPEEAERTVTVNPFYFNKFEVTQHQWQIVMGYNPSLNKDCPYCPVENVSWEEVMKFVEKLNSISGRKFRLPTEAEWEYVAKIGGKAEIDTAGGPEEFVKKTAWHFQNANNQTHQIGTKEPNIAGIFDLTGNVSEWCSDWYSAFYGKEAIPKKSPQGPPAGKERVVRGGNFKDSSGDRFRPSLRNKRPPLEKSGEVGFRLVLDVD